MRGFQRGRFLAGDRALDRGLHLLEGADLDLPHTFARHAEFGRQIFQRYRLVGEAPCLEDALSAPIKAYRAKDK